MSLQLGKPLKVKKRIQETTDCVSLVLEIPSPLAADFRYQPGQFVTFFMNINGEAINRSYSLATSPFVDSDFKVSIKKVRGGKGSTYLCESVREGDTLYTSPPAGNFFIPNLSEKGTHYILVAAGSGITPIMSILKTVLSTSLFNQVTLIYANRDKEAVIFAHELETLVKQNQPRLSIHHILSKQQGRLTEKSFADLKRSLPKTDKPEQFYLCGPTDFMAMIRSVLTRSGHSPAQIRSEDFAQSVHKPHESLGAVVNEDWTVIGTIEESQRGKPETLEAEFNGQKMNVAANADQSLLETLLEAGHQPPYSCMDGACMACLAKVVEGQVYQDDLGVLTEENVKNGEILTCRAKPLSKHVRITYDTF